MKKHIILLLFFFITLTAYTQELDFKIYSYSELFQMIESEPDSVFELRDALIKINYQTDSLFFIQNDLNETPFRKDTLEIAKKINLTNVHFENPIYSSAAGKFKYGFLANIHFKERVSIRESAAIFIQTCFFDQPLVIGASGKSCIDIGSIQESYGIIDFISINKSKFNNGLDIFYNCNFSEDLATNVQLVDNEFLMSEKSEFHGTSLRLSGRQFGSFSLNQNKFQQGSLVLIENSLDGISLVSNDFTDAWVQLSFSNYDRLGVFYIEDNIFNTVVAFGLSDLKKNHDIYLNQFSKGFLSYSGFFEYYSTLLNREERVKNINQGTWKPPLLIDTLRTAYLTDQKIEILKSYEAEMSLKGIFYDYYKSNHMTSSANKVYVDMKDLETERLKYEYKTNPSFDSFFTLKINQFLKVFSDYGTKPSKAIVFSMYVILAFAMIYLFFPNSWDQHGRKRLMDRYAFFLKYMKKDAGIHEVYLEDKKTELMEYDSFKELVSSSKEQVPRFFIATGLPLYKWAISGTKLHAAFLSKVDIMKGTWQDLPPHKRFGKGILLTTAFTLALTYDIFIKVLNALMLSINTFTTLGFGEIPIKGLPRYLAIIQGFVGWFMLTIFSVSLISQLLN